MEKELKLDLLEEKNYRRLQERLGRPRKVVQQVNRYWDSRSGELRAARIMLRVREEGERVLLTLKTEAQVSDGYFQAEEYEVPLAPELWQKLRWGHKDFYDLDEEPIRVLQQLVGRHKLIEVAAMENTRMAYDWGNGHLLELDRTVMADRNVQYELEFETDDLAACRELERRLEEWGVAYQPQTRTKYQRLLESMGVRTEEVV